MKAQDLPPSRMERAGYKMRDLFAVRGQEPSGLIVYSGSAHLVNTDLVHNEEEGEYNSAVLLQIENSIVYFNAPANHSSFGTASYSGSCTTPLPEGAATEADPLFTSAATGDAARAKPSSTSRAAAM